MRDAIASVIDPEAFTSRTSNETERRRDEARRKADQIIALEFDFEEIPPDVQATISALECDLTGAELLERAAAARFTPMAATDGRPVYTAIAKPLDDGSLFLAVLVADDGHPDNAKPVFVGETLADPDARRLAAEIEVAAAGGGSA